MTKKSIRAAFLTGYLDGVKYTSGPVLKGGFIVKSGKKMRLITIVSSISSMISDRTIEWLMRKPTGKVTTTDSL